MNFQLKNYSIFLVSGLIACSDARLNLTEISQEINVQATGTFCMKDPDDIARKTKLLFVVDKSGSNQTTDSGSRKRADNIENFYRANMNNSNLRWGMISFQDPGTQSLIVDRRGREHFTDDQRTVLNAIDSLRSNPDDGSTPYGAALNLARSTIDSDIRLFPEEDNLYMIFFISDGEPTDITSVSELESTVQGLMNLKPGSIYLSSAYYGPLGPVAEDRLQRIARIGQGKYINFNESGELDFSELIVKPTTEPWQLKNILVYNLNASICEDGRIGVDSDGDAVCDLDEVKVGLNPRTRFSKAESGFGDYFNWREIKYRETLPRCADRSDVDIDLLTKCEEDYITNLNPTGTQRKHGDPLNPDTDFDGFLDGIEIFTFRDKASAMDANNMLGSADGERESAGTQVAQHRNPLIADPAAFTYDTTLRPLGISPRGQNCYEISQTRLQLFQTLGTSGDTGYLKGWGHEAGENMIYIHFIQTRQSDPNGPGVLNYSFQKLMVDDGSVIDGEVGHRIKINDTVFNQYKVSKKL